MNRLRYLWVAALMLVALVIGGNALAQRGRSGGFGGGRGGFSSSRSSSSFGGSRSSSSFGGSRSSFGGGPVYYGGPRIFFFGGGRGGGTIILIFIGVIGAIVVAGLVVGFVQTRYGVVVVGINLRNGEKYARKLDRLVTELDYSDPKGRAKALHMIAKSIQMEDVVDAFVVVQPPWINMDQAGAKAEEIARGQMQYIGIDPNKVNVADTEGRAVKIDMADGDIYKDKTAACVVSLVVSAKRPSVARVSSGEAGALSSALDLMDDVPSNEMDALYFYYSPNADDHLDPHTANAMFLDMKAAARR
jgi:hypothetical protein